ncbi:MAG: DsbA family protein [Pseudomonadota bacterium]
MRIFSIAALAAAAMMTAAPGLGVAQSDSDASEAFSQEQRDAIREEIRTYLLEEPEIMIEVMRELEERRRVAEQRRSEQALVTLAPQIFDDGYSYVGGNVDGDVTLVEFLDYRCGFCKRAHGEVAAVLETDPNIRLVIKEFPILGPDSEFASRAAMASMKQQDGELYKAFSDALMEERNVNRAAVERIAGEVGLDWGSLETEMESPEITEQIEKNYELAQALDINGTPAFIIGDEVIRGYVEADVLIEQAEAARSSN